MWEVYDYFTGRKVIAFNDDDELAEWAKCNKGNLEKYIIIGGGIMDQELLHKLFNILKGKMIN